MAVLMTDFFTSALLQGEVTLVRLGSTEATLRAMTLLSMAPHATKRREQEVRVEGPSRADKSHSQGGGGNGGGGGGSKTGGGKPSADIPFCVVNKNKKMVTSGEAKQRVCPYHGEGHSLPDCNFTTNKGGSRSSAPKYVWWVKSNFILPDNGQSFNDVNKRE